MMEQELTKFLTFWDHLNENEKELLKQKINDDGIFKALKNLN